MHSSWFYDPCCYHDIVGIAFAVSLDLFKVPYGAEKDHVEDDRVVATVVELCYFGVLGEPYAEELVDRASIFIVVASQLVRRAYEEDLAPPSLRGIAGVVLPAAAVLRPYPHTLVILYVAA